MSNLSMLLAGIGSLRSPGPLSLANLASHLMTGRGLGSNLLPLITPVATAAGNKLGAAVQYEMGRDKGTPPPVTITPTVRAMNEGEQAMADQAMKQLRTFSEGGNVDMGMTRAQLEKQVKGFSTAGAVNIFDSPAYKDYEETLRQIRERDRTSADDVTGRVQELQGIFQSMQPRRKDIFDLATALSKGFTANAENVASPLGYGLAAGFNLFSDAANQTREEKRKLQQELGMLAYKQLEEERKEEAEIDQLLAEQKLEVLLEQMKLGGAYFPGKDVKSQILNTLLRGEADPKFKETPEYKIAKAEYEKITRNIVQTEGGAQIIEQVPRRVDEIFGPSTSPAVTAPPQVPGYTYEGIGKDGDHYYRKDGTNEYIKLPSNKVSP